MLGLNGLWKIKRFSEILDITIFLFKILQHSFTVQMSRQILLIKVQFFFNKDVFQEPRVCLVDKLRVLNGILLFNMYFHTSIYFTIVNIAHVNYNIQTDVQIKTVLCTINIWLPTSLIAHRSFLLKLKHIFIYICYKEKQHELQYHSIFLLN